jgi:Lrp/AsnC family transcriptional regulator, leucine-responsive regulatory protein
MFAMSLDLKRGLDEVDWQLLTALQDNARLSFSELGRRVGLTQPAVAERIRRLEDSGVIGGYRAELNLERVGLGLTALIRFALRRGTTQAEALGIIRDLPEILECHHVTGGDCYYIKAVVADVRHLESLIGHLSTCGETTTSIVLSSPVTRRVIDQPATYEARLSSAAAERNGYAAHGSTRPGKRAERGTP